ncbi:unnamed protein product, partial [Symbiodinium sp. KB8]
EAFPLPALAPLVSFADRAAFDPERAAHSADVFVIAVWFMLREIEVAAARVSDMVVSPGLVVLDLPLHKTATGGERTLTRRSLRCAHAPALPGPCGHAPPGAPRGGRPVVLGGAAVPGQGRRHPVQGGVGGLSVWGARGTYQDANGRLCIARRAGDGAQLAVPLALAHATTDVGQSDEGPGAQLAAPFVPAVRPERAVPEADRGPEHFIYLARTRRLHKPDPDEACADRAAWRAVVGAASWGGLLPSLLPGGAGRLQRGCGEFVGLVLPGLGVLSFVSQGLVYLRVRRLDVRFMTPDRRERGSAEWSG